MQKNNKFAPKHEGDFAGSFGDHLVWNVNAQVLHEVRNTFLAVKVGYSNEPDVREAARNRPMAQEVTGSRWKAEFKQPASSENAAREFEHSVLDLHNNHKLSSKGEILAGVDPTLVFAAIGTVMRQRSI